MTIFGEILRQAIDRVPGARGASFADWDGETVDAFSSQIGDTNLRLIGAHWGVIYYLVRSTCDKLQLGPIVELILEFELQRVVIRRVTDEYHVVMALAPQSNLAAARQALVRVAAQLRDEM